MPELLEALYYLPTYNQTWLLVVLVLYLLTYFLIAQKYLYLEFPVYKTKQSTITTFDFGLCHSNIVVPKIQTEDCGTLAYCSFLGVEKR